MACKTDEILFHKALCIRQSSTVTVHPHCTGFVGLLRRTPEITLEWKSFSSQSGQDKLIPEGQEQWSQEKKTHHINEISMRFTGTRSSCLRKLQLAVLRKISVTRGEPKGKWKMEIYTNMKQQQFTEQTNMTYEAREE